jgi:hypothetical protein
MIATLDAGQTATQAKQAPEPTTAEPSAAAWHGRFLTLLPTIRRHAQWRFRKLAPAAREEATAEVVASSLVSYARLVAVGQEDRAYATSLARYAVAQYRAGRRVGSRLNVRDATSDYCHQEKGVSVERLDRFDERWGDWQKLAVEDRRATPAEVATLRVDFAAWLESLPERTRQVAETLATGEATGRVARMFAVSPARISQLRRELDHAWRVFQGEVAPATSSDLA